MLLLMVQKSGKPVEVVTVVCPIIYRVSAPSQVGFLAGFLNHQPYFLFLEYEVFLGKVNLEADLKFITPKRGNHLVQLARDLTNRPISPKMVV